MVELQSLVDLLTMNGEELTDARILSSVVRPEAALGPIRLGVSAQPVDDVISSAGVEITEPLFLPPKMHGGLCYGHNHLLGPDGHGRELMLEWLAGEDDRVAVLRLLLVDERHPLGLAAMTSSQKAFHAADAHGPGVQRKRKPKHGTDRPWDWQIDGHRSTLGMIQVPFSEARPLLMWEIYAATLPANDVQAAFYDPKG